MDIHDAPVVCIRLSAVLCALACGRRYRDAQQRYYPPHLVSCRDCELGAERARGIPAGPTRDHRSAGRDASREGHMWAAHLAQHGRDIRPFMREK